MKCYIETLGCPKNMADSESAAGILERAGHTIVFRPEEADLIMVNTCGFINDAKEESIDRIFEMAEYRESGARLLVSGCLAQRYGQELYESMPEVDRFIGVNEYAKLPEYLEKLQNGETKAPPQIAGCPSAYEELGRRKPLGPTYTMYLKIAEGCNNSCAYCSIPAIRGRYHSRKPEEILEDARQAVLDGCKELILVAQDVTAYGMDLGAGAMRLPGLLERLCELEGVRWIRLMYCYEDRITEELVRVMKKHPQICPYMDIPIQHASDAVLHRMRRRSTGDSIRKTIAMLRREIPEMCIRTTLIAGFPGEKKADFKILEDFVKEMKFDRLGVFAYSKEEGTEAGSMPSQVKTDAKIRRRDRIMALQREISLENNRKKIGTVQEVLVEEEDQEAGTWIGRSRFDAPDIDNTVLFRSEKRLNPGDMVFVRITDAFDYDLVGEEV